MYHHRTDPDEQLDIVTAQPRVTSELEAYVNEWFSPNRKRVPPVDLSNDPEMRERLEALGYL
jgi:hypothetical protein